MFAFLGFIFPILIGVDYYCTPKTKDEVVINKFYIPNQNHFEYHFFTNSYRFLSDVGFYENTNIEDRITLYYTPIFGFITFVSCKADQAVYVCKPTSIYGWPLIIAGLTFICSIIIIVKSWGRKRKREAFKGDLMVILGIINVFLCAITIIATLFHVPY